MRKAAQPLVDEGKVKTSYVDDIIKGVKEMGPYIVLTKHVALPHARPESGALESAIGIATLKTPVEFGNEDNDPVKYLFSLSAKDSSEHLGALADLAVLFEVRLSLNSLTVRQTPKKLWIILSRKEE